MKILLILLVVAALLSPIYSLPIPGKKSKTSSSSSPPSKIKTTNSLTSNAKPNKTGAKATFKEYKEVAKDKEVQHAAKGLGKAVKKASKSIKRVYRQYRPKPTPPTQAA
jgi:hypothetical protein